MVVVEVTVAVKVADCPTTGGFGFDVSVTVLEVLPAVVDSDPEVLVAVAVSVGLDADRARTILASDEYAAEVRNREQLYQRNGIHAVPAVILNDKYLVQGGQPVEAFERALAQVAAEK